VEALLFVTRGTTDSSLRPISFATEGTEGFLGQVYKADTQDFVGKLEGYAIQGLKGSVFLLQYLFHLHNIPRCCKKCEATHLFFAI
jgi:hypothetical protein